MRDYHRRRTKNAPELHPDREMDPFGVDLRAEGSPTSQGRDIFLLYLVSGA
jgi:hypothetical protein